MNCADLIGTLYKKKESFIKKYLFILIVLAALFIVNGSLSAFAVIIGPPIPPSKSIVPPAIMKVGPVVTAIEIKGNKTVPESEILDCGIQPHRGYFDRGKGLE